MESGGCGEGKEGGMRCLWRPPISPCAKPRANAGKEQAQERAQHASCVCLILPARGCACLEQATLQTPLLYSSESILMPDPPATQRVRGEYTTPLSARISRHLAPASLAPRIVPTLPEGAQRGPKARIAEMARPLEHPRSAATARQPHAKGGRRMHRDGEAAPADAPAISPPPAPWA